jgi:dimethylargininase
MSQPEFQYALVREPSPCYAAFYAARGIQVSSALANLQHDAYSKALNDAGLKLYFLPGHPTLHDCVFIEDTAILWRDRALITRMTPLREGEQAAVKEWLITQGFDIVTLPPDARIEGGDVMHLEDQTWVGLTERTNRAGAEALQNFLAPFNRPVQTIPVNRCLHLKSAMTYLGNQTLLVSPALIDVELPGGYSMVQVPATEAHAANVLRINNTIIAAAGFPETHRLLRSFAQRNDCRMIEVGISEFQKGDGAITCSSLPW